MGIYHYPAVSTTLFGGTGKDGIFNPQSDYNFDDAEGSWIIKHFSAINIPAGVKVSTTNRVKGVILYCSGNFIVDGEIDLDGKGYGSSAMMPYLTGDVYKVDGVFYSAWNKYCQSVKGGDGGGSGGHGSGSSYTGGAGDHAGGSGAMNSFVTGVNASGWSAGRVFYSNSYSIGGIPDNSPVNGGDYGMGGGGAGYFGTFNAGGNSGYASGLQFSNYNGTNATLTTSSAKYGGGFLLIIAKGTITLGSTANIHCNGEAGTAGALWHGSDGGSGGGVIVLLSQGAQSINGSATQTVSGGSGGAASTYGGAGGDGDVGTIVNQQVA